MNPAKQQDAKLIAFLHTDNEKSKKEIKKTTSLTTESKE